MRKRRTQPTRWASMALGMLLVAALFLPGLPGAVSPAALPAFAPTDGDEGIAVPILMYHGVLKDSNRWNAYVISPAELESDLKYLRQAGYTTIGIADLIAYVYDSAPLPEKPVLLTFDDGYLNNYVYAYPLLQKYEMKAVLSVIGIHSDYYTANPDDNAIYAHVNWQQVREMAASGRVEIENHSYNLHTITSSRTASMMVSGESLPHYRQMLMADAIRLQARIDEETGRIPQCYTYPYGLVSRESVDILREMGFRCTLSCSTGVNQVTRDPDSLILMKRLLRPHGTSAAEVLRRVGG